MDVRDRVREVIERYGRELLRYPNVIGFSNVPQRRIRGDRVVDEYVVRVYVVRKVPERELRRDEVIPRELDGVGTDVVELGRIRKLGFRERYRPSPAGVSTSRADTEAAGTIGWFMVDEDGRIYMLSNNHVWTRENEASVGDPILQPALLDGGDPERDVIARLAAWVDIDFSGNPNTVDVAIAEPVDLAQVYTSIMVLGGVTGKAEPVQGGSVRKVGRSTGLTEATVVDVSATLSVEYDRGKALFQDVFVARGEGVVVRGGDSGSPVLDEGGRFLGLLFAGSDDGRTMVVCKAVNIESALRTRLGRKIWVLLANSYPPFREVVRVVYPPHLEAVAVSLRALTQLTAATLLTASLAYSVAYLMKEAGR